jgi:hypothetical protein
VVLKRVAEDTPRPIREIIPEVPQWLCDLIIRLHAKRPEERFASAREVADRLTQPAAPMPDPGNIKPCQVAAGATVQTTTQSQETTDATLARRRPFYQARPWVAAAGVLLTLLSGLGFAEATGVTQLRGSVWSAR